jgi:hypothetical protein
VAGAASGSQVPSAGTRRVRRLSLEAPGSAIGPRERLAKLICGHGRLCDLRLPSPGGPVGGLTWAFWGREGVIRLWTWHHSSRPSNVEWAFNPPRYPREEGGKERRGSLEEFTETLASVKGGKKGGGKSLMMIPSGNILMTARVQGTTRGSSRHRLHPPLGLTHLQNSQPPRE